MRRRRRGVGVTGARWSLAAYGGPLPRRSSSWEVLLRLQHGAVVEVVCAPASSMVGFAGWLVGADADLVEGVLEAW
jgi:hypothetical protein